MSNPDYPEAGTPVWEWTPRQWRVYRQECIENHRVWLVHKAFENAVLSNDWEEIVKLAPQLLEVLAFPADGEDPPPPEAQPKNRAEAMARMK